MEVKYKLRSDPREAHSIDMTLNIHDKKCAITILSNAYGQSVIDIVVEVQCVRVWVLRGGWLIGEEKKEGIWALTYRDALCKQTHNPFH